MEGSHESAIAVGDFPFPTVDNEKTIFSVKDIELEAFESIYLGDTQDAREDHGVADLRIGKTSLDAVFTEIIYGSYKSRPACRAMIDFTIQSTADFRVRTAKLACTVGSEATNKLKISISSDIIQHINKQPPCQEEMR